MVRSSRIRRLGLVGALVATVAAVAPAAAPAKILGGATKDDWPVVVEINKSGKRVVQTSIGLGLNCTIPLRDGVGDDLLGMLT